jgi:hypothetical protein
MIAGIVLASKRMDISHTTTDDETVKQEFSKEQN